MCPCRIKSMIWKKSGPNCCNRSVCLTLTLTAGEYTRLGACLGSSRTESGLLAALAGSWETPAVLLLSAPCHLWRPDLLPLLSENVQHHHYQCKPSTHTLLPVDSLNFNCIFYLSFCLRCSRMFCQSSGKLSGCYVCSCAITANRNSGKR